MYCFLVCWKLMIFLQHLTNRGLLFVGSVWFFCLDSSHDTQIAGRKFFASNWIPKKILEVKWRYLFKVVPPTSYKWSFGSPYKWPHVKWCNWGDKKPYSCFLGPPCWNMWGPHWPTFPPSKFDARFRNWQLMLPEILLLYMQILLKRRIFSISTGWSDFWTINSSFIFPWEDTTLLDCFPWAPGKATVAAKVFRAIIFRSW